MAGEVLGKEWEWYNVARGQCMWEDGTEMGLWTGKVDGKGESQVLVLRL